MNENVDEQNIRETTMSFSVKVRHFFSLLDETRDLEDRCKIVLQLYSLLSSVTIWIEGSIGSPFDRFKITVQDKSYELLKQIYLAKISEDTKKETTEIIHKTLRMICCNNQVDNRYCKKKKSGDLCTFHTNQKKKIVSSINETKLLNRDVLSIVFDYII
jgi:hypothetical protein